jgi:cytochrome b subunit of formate dehydrogenase
MVLVYLKGRKTKFVLILILAFVIRLAGIVSRPIWYDEVFSILISEQGLSVNIGSTPIINTALLTVEEHLLTALYFTFYVDALFDPSALAQVARYSEIKNKPPRQFVFDF